MERTLVIMKPDCLQRNLLGEILYRFERKGLKIVGLKMAAISDAKVEEHYEHHVDKPFFAGLKAFMQSAPVVLVVLEGLEAVETVRFLTGDTKGRKADAGTIRGDFAMSVQANIVHASDSVENGEREVTRFFANDELFQYQKLDETMVYAPDERK